MDSTLLVSVLLYVFQVAGLLIWSKITELSQLFHLYPDTQSNYLTQEKTVYRNLSVVKLIFLHSKRSTVVYCRHSHIYSNEKGFL